MTKPQPIDAKGRHLPTREVVATDLLAILEQYGIDEYRDPVWSPEDIKSFTKQLTDYVMEKLFEHWSADVRHGIALGRQEVLAMLQSLHDIPDVTRDHKYSPGEYAYLKAYGDGMRAYKREVDQAVAAISKGMEGSDMESLDSQNESNPSKILPPNKEKEN